MDIFNIKTFIINDANYLKHLSGTFYFNQDDYEFLDIRDNRNGEIYEFYRLKDKENNWTFYRNYQEHSLYSMNKAKTEHGLFGTTILRIDSYKNRPYNPFEKYNEYKIKISNLGNILLIKYIG
jgi:hypothetical protein